MTADWNVANGDSTVPPFLFDPPKGLAWADAVRSAFTLGSMDDAFDYLEQAAKTESRAEGILGILHATSGCVKCKPNLAYSFVESAAKKGDAVSHANLAFMQFLGIGTFIDPVSADVNLREAIRKGVKPDALDWLLYQPGSFFKLTDFVEIVKNLELASRQGLPAAKAILGTLNAIGLGHPPCAPRCEERARELEEDLRLGNEPGLAELIELTLSKGKSSRQFNWTTTGGSALNINLKTPQRPGADISRPEYPGSRQRMTTRPRGFGR